MDNEEKVYLAISTPYGNTITPDDIKSKLGQIYDYNQMRELVTSTVINIATEQLRPNHNLFAFFCVKKTNKTPKGTIEYYSNEYGIGYLKDLDRLENFGKNVLNGFANNFPYEQIINSPILMYPFKQAGYTTNEQIKDFIDARRSKKR